MIHDSNFFWHFKLLFSYDFSSQSVAEMPLVTAFINIIEYGLSIVD